jgi:peptide/nickel transport system permease protein
VTEPAHDRPAALSPLTVPGFPLGSDQFGRDLPSRLLWGVRPTLVMVSFVAAVRLVLGMVIGLRAHLKIRKRQRSAVA